MKVIVINGQPRAGKDLFVTMCQKYVVWCKNISTVDFVKQVAFFCGWDGIKTPENRAFLSDLKDLLTKWQDVPFRKVQDAAYNYDLEAQIYDFSTDEVVVFVHCREPQEIEKFVKEMNALTLLIRRPSIEGEEQSNHADAEVFNYDYDYTIYNDGTVEDLENKAVEFLNKLKIRIKQ